MPDLQHDKDLLLGGFDGQIKLAILINWPVNRSHMTVADKLEVWEPGPNATSTCLQREVSFTVSPNQAGH